MKMKSISVVAAAVLAFAAASVNAQTVAVAMSGSSALYLELGQASASFGPASPCHWTTTSKIFTLTDNRFSPALTDSGTAWITWSPGTGSCGSPTGAYVVNLDVSTDSTVGNRCFFAVLSGSAPAGGPGCVLTTTATSVAGAGALNLPTADTTLPPAIITLLATGNSGSPFHINASATDIRPEDAAFATERALAPCGSVVSGQYLGLGYQTATPNLGVAIAGSSLNHAGGGSFNVAGFNLTGHDPVTSGTVRSFSVDPVGAVPVVVFVNPSDTTGLGSLAVTNIDRAVLSGYFDGTLGRVTDVIPQTFTSNTAGTFVYVREPLSGTYNTFEFNIPNNQENQSSVDVGLAALNAFNNSLAVPNLNCGVGGVQGTGSTATVLQNPLQETGLHSGVTTGGRFRAIGTGNEVAAVLAQSDGMGFAFWSAANFKNALPSNAKYLTVDGIDPLRDTWVDGAVPTAGNDLLGDVSFSHIKDGSYPIWSQLRVVCDTSSSCTAVSSLTSSALSFLSPFQPDFVPGTQLAIFRSHFAPPGISFPCSAGANTPSNGVAGEVECGGDVAGLVYTIQADGDYNADNGTSTGINGRRQ
jgi:hypothetical protein